MVTTNLNIKLYLITANLGEKQITEKNTKTRCFLLDKNLNIYENN